MIKKRIEKREIHRSEPINSADSSRWLDLRSTCIVESSLERSSKLDGVENRSFADSDLRGSTWMNSLRITRDYSIWLYTVRVYRFELGENFVRRGEEHTVFRRFEKTKHAHGAKYFGNTLIQPRIIRNFPATPETCPRTDQFIAARNARALKSSPVSVRLTLESLITYRINRTIGD